MAIKPGIARKSSNKNPPFFSHEFVIQNHADIVSCVAMVFVVGLMLPVSRKSQFTFLFSLAFGFPTFFVHIEMQNSISDRRLNAAFGHTSCVLAMRTKPFPKWKITKLKMKMKESKKILPTRNLSSANQIQ